MLNAHTTQNQEAVYTREKVNIIKTDQPGNQYIAQASVTEASQSILFVANKYMFQVKSMIYMRWLEKTKLLFYVKHRIKQAVKYLQIYRAIQQEGNTFTCL
jgi:hypothetical protein